jgi:hypothetical protein
MQVFSLLVVFILALILSVTIAANKRIGGIWGFIFLSFWIIPGIVAIVLSPPLKSLPLTNYKDRKYNNIIGCVCLLLFVSTIFAAFNAPARPVLVYDTIGYNIAMSAYFLLFSVYMFNRISRHEKIYEEQKNRKKAEEIQKNNPEDLDVPLYDHV